MGMGGWVCTLVFTNMECFYGFTLSAGGRVRRQGQSLYEQEHPFVCSPGLHTSQEEPHLFLAVFLLKGHFVLFLPWRFWFPCRSGLSFDLQAQGSAGSPDIGSECVFVSGLSG